MKKRANDKELTINFYSSSTADERGLNKERDQIMCPLSNEIIIQGCTLSCGCTFGLEALRMYYKQQKQMSKNKREEERELVKCPLCGE